MCSRERYKRDKMRWYKKFDTEAGMVEYGKLYKKNKV